MATALDASAIRDMRTVEMLEREQRKFAAVEH